MNITSYHDPESWIESVLKESHKDYAHRSDFPGMQYGIVLRTGKYASNLDESNWETITDHMQARFPREITYTSNALWIKLVTKRGKPTQAAYHIYDILYALEDNYPVYNSDDLNRREYSQQIESIESVVKSYLADNVPSDYAQVIFSWLWDNDQESIVTEDHAYCTDIGAFCAAIALGYIDISDPDDLVVPSYVMRDIDRFIVSAFTSSKRF
jgi:hypothetical protein